MISERQYRAVAEPFEVPDPKQWFEHQVAVFTSGMPLLTVEEIERLRRHIPETGEFFLIVPRKPAHALLENLMPLIVLNDRRGVCGLKENRHRDLVDHPHEPLILRGVDDGRLHKDITPREGRLVLKHEQRHSFTTWWGIAMCIAFPWVLKSHSLILIGSVYSEDRVPELMLDRSGWAYLDYIREARSKRGAGVPSCATVEVC
ncbi:MAG TPA: DUF5701 family protein [Candidatus Paceibacterota bacterium]